MRVEASITVDYDDMASPEEAAHLIVHWVRSDTDLIYVTCIETDDDGTEHITSVPVNLQEDYEEWASTYYNTLREHGLDPSEEDPPGTDRLNEDPAEVARQYMKGVSNG